MPQHADYARFHHVELSEPERAIVDRYRQATNIPDGAVAPDGTRRAGDRLIAPDGFVQPIGMMGAHIEIAYGRARKQLKQLGTQPEALEDVRGFEGIDPEGHYGPHDLAYTQRILRIRQAAAVASPEVRDALTVALSMLKDGTTPAGILHNSFKTDCESVRTMHRAAKLCLSMEGYELLMEQAEAVGHNNIEAMDKVLNGLEYVAGIRTDAPTVQERGYVAQCFGWSERTMEQFHKLSPQKSPVTQNLTIPFADFDHRLKQQYLAHPSNWDKGSKDVPDDYRTEAVADQAWEQYATESVKGTLNVLYHDTEARHAFTRQLTGVNRTKLITVDGKTVDQLMREDYAKKLLPPGDYERWQMANMEAMTARIVSAGLMAGKRVEAFLTNAEGDVMDEPVTISKEGYEPSPLKPVTMNTVQRFMSKHGFYKERVAKEEEYARVMAAREQVKAQNRVERWEEMCSSALGQKAPYMAEYEQVHGPLPRERQHSTLNTSRDALVGCCACYLVAQGYEPDDIFDVTKLTAEKAAVGRRFMEMSEAAAQLPTPETRGMRESQEAYQARADAFYASSPSLAMRKQVHDAFEIEMGRWIYQGQKLFKENAEQRLEGRDLRTFPNDPDYNRLAQVIHIGFDVSQLKADTLVAEGYYSAAGEDYARSPEMQQQLAGHSSFQGYVPGTPLNREQERACAFLVDSPANNMASVLDPINVGNRGKSHLQEENKVESIKAQMVSAAALAELQRRKEASPQTKVSELLGYEMVGTFSTCATVAICSTFRDNLDRDLVQRDRIHQEMRSGKLKDLAETIVFPKTLEEAGVLMDRATEIATELYQRTLVQRPQIQQPRAVAQPQPVAQPQQSQQTQAPRQGGMGRH